MGGAQAAGFSDARASGRLSRRRGLIVVTVPSDPQWRPPFNSFLGWYVMLHCLISVILFAAATAAAALMVAFGFVDLATILGLAFETQLLWIVAGATCGAILAILVGRRHGMKLRQGILGFFVGSFVSWIVRLPLELGSAHAGGRFPYLDNLPPVAALVLVYIFLLSILIRYKRRNSLNRRRFAQFIEPFT
jgi:hypothetical protein